MRFKNEDKLLYLRVVDRNNTSIFMANEFGEQSELLAKGEGVFSQLYRNNKDKTISWVLNKELLTFNVTSRQKTVISIDTEHEIEALLPVNNKRYIALTHVRNYYTREFNYLTNEYVRNKRDLLNEIMTTKTVNNIRLVSTGIHNHKVWKVENDQPQFITEYAYLTLKNVFFDSDNRKALIVHSQGVDIFDLDTLKKEYKYLHNGSKIVSGGRLSNEQIVVLTENNQLILIDQNSNETTSFVIDAVNKVQPISSNQVLVKSKSNHFQKYNLNTHTYETIFDWESNNAIRDWHIFEKTLWIQTYHSLYRVDLDSSLPRPELISDFTVMENINFIDNEKINFTRVATS